MLLLFRKGIIEAARKADKGIIDVRTNESWTALKILVPYGRYRHPEGLADLRAQIEAENEGVIIPPTSILWMRAKRTVEEHFQRGRLPLGSASVVFKVPNKVAGEKLMSEIWVAGNKFKAHPYIANKAFTLYGVCSLWGHSEFQCPRSEPVCAVCLGGHRTESLKCEMATCGAIRRVCCHAAMKCPNCGGNHQANDARCPAKLNAIAIARGMRGGSQPDTCQIREEAQEPRQLLRPVSAVTLAALRSGLAPDWTEDPDKLETIMETEEETSGTVPPMAV